MIEGVYAVNYRTSIADFYDLFFYSARDTENMHTIANCRKYPPVIVKKQSNCKTDLFRFLNF